MAASRTSRKRRRRIDASALLALIVLLSLPIYASTQLASGWHLWILLAFASALSVFAFHAYRRDKRRAEAGEWRVPESTLHILSLFGGWPAASVSTQDVENLVPVCFLVDCSASPVHRHRCCARLALYRKRVPAPQTTNRLIRRYNHTIFVDSQGMP